MTNRKLTERQIRWSELLSQYNFQIKFRPGNKACRPDALSGRPQDIPKDLDDPRLKEREIKLLRNEWFEREEKANEINLPPLEPGPGREIPKGEQLFE
ncbi:hypothetical protein K3495_g16202 [Podosphaera aphanis]|nr:hypothetical protein K3495_g16202 [Podosphaera aphanis]